ncbi:MAG TPA: hypothetical protein V6D10_02560 [Trichocoleus sp.]|jgi:hypothetical protein
MKYNIYGKFKVEVVRQGNVWRVFRIGLGVKRPEPNVHIQLDASELEILVALDDAFHEWASPDANIEEISE